jgi:hypothetical protein
VTGTPRPLWVAFDIDGTLGCALPALRVALAARLGLPVDAIRDGGPYEQFGFTTGCDRTDTALRECALGEWEQVASQAQPLPGALDAVIRVAEAGRLLGYVTRRPPRMWDVTYAWLSTHGFPVASYLLRHMPDEHACKSVQAVGLAVGWSHREGGPNHLSNITLVEDSGREALSAARNGLRVHLIDQPHNQTAQHERITRIPDLTHLKAELHD